MTHLGILREKNNPPDPRVPLTPENCRQLISDYPGLKISVETCTHRCFSDDAFKNAGCHIVDLAKNCDLLLGVKEIPIHALENNATYLIFSHTHKGQKENRHLLKALCEKSTTVYDYELLKDENGQRILGFGRFAGIVGAHYALIMAGKTSGRYDLPQANTVSNLQELLEKQQNIDLPPLRIALTGKGNVARGCREILENCNIREVSPDQLKDDNVAGPVFAQFDSEDLFEKADGSFSREEFRNNPVSYQSKFNDYLSHIDTLINAIYWDPDAPRLFEKEDLRNKNRRLVNISDISCDVEGSVPITMKTTSEAPFKGYDPNSQTYTNPFEPGAVNVMAVNNLPSELPVDASEEFGKVLAKKVIPCFISDRCKILENARIVDKGTITSSFKYLEKFIN